MTYPVDRTERMAQPAAKPFAMTRFDYLLYAVIVFCWGTSWIGMHYQIGIVAPEVSMLWRTIIACFFMTIWVILAREPLFKFVWRDHLRFAALGIFIFSLNFTLMYYGSRSIPSGLAAVVFSLSSIFNLLLARVFFKQKTENRVVIGALLGATGVAFMFWPQVSGNGFNHDALFGLGLCVAGTLSFCCGNILSASAQKAGLPVKPATAWGMFYAVMFLAAFSALRGQAFIIEPTYAYVSALFFLAIFSSVIAFATYLTLLGRIGPARAGYSSVMFPVVALAISTVLEGYTWTAIALFGLALALSGNLLVLRR